MNDDNNKIEIAFGDAKINVAGKTTCVLILGLLYLAVTGDITDLTSVLCALPSETLHDVLPACSR